jgi:PKD repeat protein
MLISGTTIYIGCKRTDESKLSHKDVKPHFSIDYSSITYSHGMLVFTDMASFKNTMQGLIALDTVKTNPDSSAYDSTDHEPALRDFEHYFSFVSLRQNLNNALDTVLLNGTWPAVDPDEHFIASPILRTVINPKLEVKIGDIIYKFINKCTTLEIKNSDWTLLSNIDAHMPNIMADLIDTNVYIIANNFDCNSLQPNFYYTLIGTNYTFVDASLGSPTSYYWDFGEVAAPSTLSTPPSFSASSTTDFSVTLVTQDGNGNLNKVKKEYKRSPCNAVADFAWTTSALTANFTDESKPSDLSTITTWSWDFGDGNTSTAPSPLHTYSKQNTYSVTLTITDNSGCVKSRKLNVVVKQTDVCCFGGGDIHVDYIDYDGGHHKIKSKFYITNVIFYFEVGVKTYNFEKGFLGIWWQKKTDVIRANFGGTLYTPAAGSGNNQCDDTRAESGDYTIYNKSAAFTCDGQGDHPLFMQVGCIGSYHYAKHGSAEVSKTYSLLEACPK